MKLAFVVQRYGIEVDGGVERRCRLIAEHLSKYINVEIITTCAVDSITWDNYYPEGKGTLNGITVWRFPVDFPRDINKFNTFSNKLLKKHTRDDEIKWMKLQGPYSTKLLEFIKKQKDNYDFFIFFTYLYCTTFFGLPIVKEKALLSPTANTNDSPLYFTIFKKIFKSPIAIIYNTPEEKRLVNSLFDNEHVTSDIIAMGIDPPIISKKTSYQDIKSNFILYIGRIDELKDCKKLFEYFLRYKKEVNSDLKLILLGKPNMQIPKNDDIVHLGFIDGADKYSILSHSKLLIHPSKHESLSQVILQALICGVPVLVNGGCDVSKGHCIRSNGGLWYEDYDEFKECLDLLLSNKHLRKKLGENGKKYVKKNYYWDMVEKKYMDLLNKLKNNSSTA